MRHTLPIILIFTIFSCNSTPPDLQDAPEARLISAEKIMSPEQRELENKIAARTLLQKITDESEKFQRIEYAYECNNSSGGILTLIKEGEELKGIRFAAAQNGENEFLSLYYKGNELVFVVQEQGQTHGEQETITQTLFYLDKNTTIRCMRKSVSGLAVQMEELIKSADFEIVPTDEALLQKIKLREETFKHETTQQNLARHFCK